MIKSQRHTVSESTATSLSAPTSRRLIVVVRSPPFYRELGRNGETTILRGSTIRSPQLSFILRQYSWDYRHEQWTWA